MGKFNKKENTKETIEKIEKDLRMHPEVTTNHEGGLSFKLEEKMELFTLVMSCLINEPKFYGKLGDTESRITALVKIITKDDPAFCLKLAKFARKEGNLRSAPVALMVETAIQISKNNAKLSDKERSSQPSIIRPNVFETIGRVDDVTEALAYYLNHPSVEGKKNMPLGLKRGLQDAFKKFSAYQLFKYDRDGNVSLGDAINILHPESKNEDTKALYAYLRGWDFDGNIEEIVKRLDKKSILKGKTKIDSDVIKAVESGEITWEVFISHFGSNQKSWNTIAPYMPYMATLRNLRNMLQNDISTESMKAVSSKLSDPKMVAKSRQFPYRFYSAYRELGLGANRNTWNGYRSGDDSVDFTVPKHLASALSSALATSVENLPMLGGTTAIFSDNSGSMHSAVSQRSRITMIEIASLMSAIAYGFSDEAIVGAFGCTFKNVQLDPNDTIFSNMNKVLTSNVGYSTNAHLAVNSLITKKKKVDRIIVFSDLQCYNSNAYSSGSLASTLKTYKKTINPNVKVYSFDLRGYGTTQFPSESGVVTLAGYSDKIFKFMEIFENGDSSILDVIDNY